jgi:hypothetical protein
MAIFLFSQATLFDNIVSINSGSIENSGSESKNENSKLLKDDKSGFVSEKSTSNIDVDTTSVTMNDSDDGVEIVDDCLIPPRNSLISDGYIESELVDKGNWPYEKFTFRKNITIDHAKVSANLTDFPVLINLSDVNLKDQVQPDGDDIIFTDVKGNKLAHEIELFDNDYNTTHSHLVAWVKVNLSSTNDTVISMYYGNPNLTNQQNPNSVWDANYVGVWHLSEGASGTGLTGLYKDSTFNSNDGTDQVSSTIKDGKVDGGQDFDGNDYIDFGSDSSLALTSGSFTVEAWMKADVFGTADSFDRAVIKKTGSDCFQLGVASINTLYDTPTFYFHVFFNDGNDVEGTEQPEDVPNAGQWYHVVGVFDINDSQAYMYVNGISNWIDRDVTFLGKGTTDDLLFGVRSDFNSDAFYDGVLDEVRISNTIRASSWISTEYENQNDPISFYSVNVQETRYIEPGEYFVDNDESNADDFADIGSHGNFTSQKYFDGTNDTLVEEGGDISNTNSLDCEGGYMVIGDGTLDWGSTAGTISFWIKFESLTPNFRLWGQSTNLEIRSFVLDEIMLDWGSDTTLDASNLGLQIDNWYFFAVTWDENADNLYFYVGNTTNLPMEKASDTNWTDTLDETIDSNNFMTSRGRLTDSVNGSGDDLRYYNAARSLADIQSDYNKSLLGDEPFLMNYYKFNGDFTDSAASDDGYASGSTFFSTDIPFTTFTPYRLDLETQWISLPQYYAYEELCINTGTTDTEDLIVEFWNGTTWQTIISDLNANSWNNVSITKYLNSSAFTIRYQDNNTEPDVTAGSWQIECALIHVWDSPPVVNDFGITDPGSGTGTFWANITDSFGVDNATLRVNNSFFSMSYNGTFWVYDFLAVFGSYYEYQIWNTSDTIGYVKTNATNNNSYSFNYDIIAPTVLNVKYFDLLGPNGTFNANVTDTWGEGVDTVMVNVTSPAKEPVVMMKTASGYINDTITLDIGLFQFKIIANDTFGNNYTSDVYFGYYSSGEVNTFPMAENLSLSPESLLSNGTMRLDYDFYDADAEDQEFGTDIKWYKNDNLQPNLNQTVTFLNASSVFIPNTFLFEGDTWYAKVTPKDFRDFGIEVTSPNITVKNTPPEIMDFSSFAGTTTSTLDANPTLQNYYFDNDNDTLVDFEIDWYKDGQPQGLSGLTVDSSLTAKGEKWSYRIRVSDGDNYSIWYQSPNETILNSVPVVLSCNIENAGNILTTDDLLANWTFSDDDSGDIQVSYTLLWYKGIFNQSALTNSVNVGSSNTSRGETWYFTIQVNDGENNSIVYVSPNIQILNSIPTASNLSITLNPFTSDVLQPNWSENDNDNDTTAWRIRWYKDGILQVNLNDTTTILSGLTKKGEIWNYTLQIFDGMNYSIIYYSPTTVIINSPPVVSSLTITENPTTLDDILAEWIYNDIDGDLEVSSWFIHWYKDGILQVDLNNTSTISYTLTKKDETWSFTLRVFDGEDYSIQYNSTPSVILNSAPTISNLELINPNNNPYFLVEDVPLNVTYTFEDVDETDNDESYIYWYRNGTPYTQYTNMLIIPANETTPGDIWNVTIIPYDGFNQDSQHFSIEIFIESRPVIFNHGIEISEIEEGYYNLWINASDERNNIERVEYNVLISAINFTFDPIIITSDNNTPNLWVLEDLSLLEKLTDLGYQKDYFIALMNTNLTIDVTIVTSVAYTNIDYSIKGYYTITFVIEDTAPPRVVDADYIWDDNNNPSSITFYSIIVDHGAGVNNVTLHYEFEKVNATNGGNTGTFWRGKYYQDRFFQYKVPMTYNGTHYIVTVPFHPNGTTNILYTIEVADKLGNVNIDAYPNGYDSHFIEEGRYEPPIILPWGLFFALFVFLIMIVAVVSFLAIKKFSGTELVGLDVDLVMNGVSEISDEEIQGSLNNHTLGIVISVFDQWHGPIPAFVEPSILRDNFEKLVDLSDRSFSASRFVEDFSTERESNFEFNIAPGIFVTSITFGFTLERPDARGGAENITLNILIHKAYDSLISQFLEHYSDIIHEIHVLMDKSSSEKDKIANEIIKLRKMITSTILSYEKMYNPVEVLDDDSQTGDFLAG